MKPVRNSFRHVHLAAQRGAALVVGLLLLAVITVLAIAGMNTSTLELQMAGNTQFRQNAFQAAEVGIEQVMRSGKLQTDAVVPEAAQTVSGSTDTYETSVKHSCAEGMWANAVGYSMGKDARITFDVTSTGRSARGATAVNTQSFYVVGPKPC